MVNDHEKKEAEIQNKDAAVKPDPETLNTTDPQDNMKGPLSSLMQSTKETFQENNESKLEADTKHDADRK